MTDEPSSTDESAAAPPEPTAGAAGADREDLLVERDLLVEDVSIDGMCGVY